MRTSIIALGVILAASGTAASAKADTFAFSFQGGGVNGAITLTYGPDTVVGDPAGAYAITGVSGVFSDANLGLLNRAITGVVPISPASPTPTNLLAPKSFSFLPIASGVSSPEGLAPGYTYDDLFYPGGSPQTASSYPFHGGFLDIYGVAFTIAGGDGVDFWSNGVVPGAGLSYGAAVTDGLTPLDYVASVAAVPEPASAALLGSFLLGAFAKAYRRGGRPSRRAAAAASSA